MIGDADSRSWRRREQPPEDVRHDHVHPELRLKCIVLGSAGAGKTSLLRRFTHGTFEGPAGNGRDNHWRRRTRGADYYTKRVNNPLFESSAAISSSVPGRDDDGSRPSAAESSHVLVQLWDTVGKETLKPQRHPAQYDAKSNFYQFLSIRPTPPSTNNSNYEHRYNNWGFLNGIAQGHGRGGRNKHERHSGPIRNIEGERINQAHQQHRGPTGRLRQNNITEPMGNALLRNIDACMLVYDATSSMSFLLLTELHSDLLQKLNTLDREDNMERVRTTHNLAVMKNASRRKRIPFIVVANKLDLLENRKTAKTIVPKRRSVIGLRDGEYNGNDFIYEYAAENSTMQPDEEQSDVMKKQSDRLTFSLKETLWSTDETYLNALQRTEDQLAANRLLILLWCNRNGIPHVEASALDGRGVDEAMRHLITAGINELRMREIDTLVSTKEETEVEKETTRPGDGMFDGGVIVASESNSSVLLDNNPEDMDENSSTALNVAANVKNELYHGPSQYYFLYQPRVDKSLDLFARYSTNDEQKCSLFQCWLSLLAFCRQ